MIEAIVSILVPLVVGSVITFWVTWHYYKKAGDELKQEAAQLRTISMGIVYMLEHPKANIEVNRDDAGNLIGLKVISTGDIQAGATVQGLAKDS